MNGQIGKFIVANWPLLQKKEFPPKLLGALFLFGLKGSDIRMLIER